MEDFETMLSESILNINTQACLLYYLQTMFFATVLTEN